MASANAHESTAGESASAGRAEVDEEIEASAVAVVDIIALGAMLPRRYIFEVLPFAGERA